MRKHNVSHLVKSEDLNHHGTLFAGRMSEWFVEASFIAAAGFTGNPDELVCLKLHGLTFTKPALKGQIIEIETTIARVGNSSLTVHGKTTALGSSDVTVEGFITFVCVDENGKTKKHGLPKVSPQTEYETDIFNQANNL